MMRVIWGVKAMPTATVYQTTVAVFQNTLTQWFSRSTPRIPRDLQQVPKGIPGYISVNGYSEVCLFFKSSNNVSFIKHGMNLTDDIFITYDR